MNQEPEGGFEQSKSYQEIERMIEEFETQVAGLPKYMPQKGPEVLTVNLESLKKKSPEELSEYLYILAGYAMYVQRCMNKNRAFERWAISKLNELEAEYLPEVDNRYGYGEKSKLARYGPPICKKLNAFLRKIQLQCDLLYDVPNNIRGLAQSINDIKFSIIRQTKEYNNER